MSNNNELELKLVKLVALMQVQLELFDSLQGTSAYRHNIKKGINMLSKDIEAYLDNMYKHLDMDREKEESYMAIQRGLEHVLNISVEEAFDLGYQPLKD